MKFTFVVESTITLCTEVEAATLEDAAEIARERPVMSLCHQCCGGDSNEEWGTELDSALGPLVEAWAGDRHIEQSSDEFMSAKECFE